MSNLNQLRDVWNDLAEQDALHAILTDPSKRQGKWDIADFMATGVAEIDTVTNHLAQIGYLPNAKGSALDFGCGVGRLTQALAQRFSSCVGIDISQHMIQEADALNRYAHCRYITSSDPVIPFHDASFTFIYSNIVLQHMPQRFSVGYLKEFVRVLAPGGVLVFGVQDSFSIRKIASLITWLRQTIRIRTRIREALGGPGDMQMHCLSESEIRRALGSAKIIDVQFVNTATKDFNGNLSYLPQAPASGYISKQYCVVKQT
jgi:ubiquinone/menaquinone biosynthesis C-methylase UbiE